MFPVLYSLTAKNQIQTWQIEVVSDKFRTHEGILDGIITTSEWTRCKGKNIGKKNETSSKEQALKEAASKHKKKLDSGYYESAKDINKAKFFEPMLAHKWVDYKSEIKFPVYSQPKLDGLRCILNKDGMFSRNGKEIISAPHVYEFYSEYIKRTNDIGVNIVLDGELYNHKFKSDFNKIISLAKKTKPTEKDLQESKKYLEYWVYDTYSNLESEAIFSARLEWLKIIKDYLDIKIVPTDIANNEEELDILYEKYLEQGFEGQMIRTVDGIYENKRSKNLLKRKEFQEDEFELVDLEEGKGNGRGMAKRAILKTREDVLFETGIIGNNGYCIDLLKNKSKIVGNMGTVIYQNLTPEGKPRFGKLKIIRNYE